MSGYRQHRRAPTWSWLGLLLAITLVLPAAAIAANVWVNTQSGVYHCPGGRYYGATKRGQFMPERDAVQHGYRAAYHAPCSGDEAQSARARVLQQLRPAASTPAVGERVWINTGSGVYHCPGTRYYGNTKRGRYASEADAIGTGNRPANGQRCN